MISLSNGTWSAHSIKFYSRAFCGWSLMLLRLCKVGPGRPWIAVSTGSLRDGSSCLLFVVAYFYIKSLCFGQEILGLRDVNFVNRGRFRQRI